jgi:hypothetical protein
MTLIFCGTNRLSLVPFLLETVLPHPLDTPHSATRILASQFGYRRSGGQSFGILGVVINFQHPMTWALQSPDRSIAPLAKTRTRLRIDEMYQPDRVRI